MKTFYNYLCEAESKGKSITFVDIDETLFFTNALIYVKKDGKVIKKLTNTEFNVYELQDGETFDFQEFRSADIFTKTSNPIEAMIKKINAMFKNISNVGSEMYLLTARADFDNKEKFLAFLRSFDIDVGHKNDGKIHVIRAGNNPGANSAEKKKVIIDKYLSTGKYYKTRLYDDAKSNLDSFLELRDDYPNVQFEPWIIDHGVVKKYKN